MADFHYDVDSDGIATIIWDCAHKSMNVLNLDAAQELDGMIDRALGDDGVCGVVITSGKADFAGGMDLNVIKKMAEMAGDEPARGLMDGIMGFHAITRKIERAGMTDKNKGGKPIAAALPGTALGIGFEIPLACHRIFAANNPKAKIGLPEILVGIFPGAGGTTRLTRLLDIASAAPILLQGKLSNPATAKRIGLIHEVVEPDALLSSAKAWVKSAMDADIVKPWDKKGFKMPGGGPYHPAGFMNYIGASAMVHGNTKGVYPAAKAMLSAIYEGAQLPFDSAIRVEARWFTHILMNPSSSAMINTLFTNKTALEKGANRPSDQPDLRVKKLGVLGAGMMGAGIAFVSARVGIEVVLLDQEQAAADRGLAKIEALLDEGIKRKKLTADKKDSILGNLTATADYAALKGCDLVIEAVFEDPKIKANVTKLAEAQLNNDAIFATNTSTLPITELAKASRDDSRFIGIHFFSPVHKMNLVEIIKGQNTAAPAVAKALDFVAQIKKTPIVVTDARFFYANRCILPYVNEGITMLAEGIAPALVENAAKMMGMPVGPLQLADEVSIDLSVKIIKATQAALGDAYRGTQAEAILFKMFNDGRMGRKSKSGFYAYDDNAKRTGLWAGLDTNWPAMADQPDVMQVKNRLAMAQVLEAVRAYEDGVLLDIREGDVGAILGWGFQPWSGGPFSWLDMIGCTRAVEICDELTAQFGERFEAPKLLRDMVSSGATFYEGFGAVAKAS